MFTIDTRTLSEGVPSPIEGQIEEDVFQLDPEDSAHPAGPISYRGEAYTVSGNLLVRGEFVVPFELTCARCSETFRATVILKEHALLEPLEGEAVIDLTEALREDILCALPDFPHCDEMSPDGVSAPRTCQAAEKFQSEDAYDTLAPEEQDEPEQADRWKALDDLELDQ